MRRGLLKDLANTPTQIVCGYRLYGPDLRRLTDLAGEVIRVDILSGECCLGTDRLDPPLGVAEEIASWLRERFDRDAIPPGTVEQATVTLKPRSEGRSLAVECKTVVATGRGSYESHGTARKDSRRCATSPGLSRRSCVRVC
jgi:hypothetical protein